jgi:hypothetical protein
VLDALFPPFVATPFSPPSSSSPLEAAKASKSGVVLNLFRVFFHISFLRFSCWLLSRGGKAAAADPSPANAGRVSTVTGS